MSDNQPLPLSEIKKRVVSSFLSLTVRQILLRAIGFISINLILARILPVETLGIFNVATAIVTFFTFFSDIGLAASLIQKKDVISKEDIYTTFTLQQIIVFTLSVVIILLAPTLASFYNLDDQGIWLIRVLGFAFFLASLKIIPSVLLERELNFKPLITVELVETLVFNTLLILGVLQGLGVWSFSIAALARGIVGVVLIYFLKPVRVGFQIDKSSAKGLLRFGIPFQLNSLLALFKDRLVPLVVAKMVGTIGIGYITWAQSLAFLPLEVMGTIVRISFPAFSRLQHDKKTLEVAVDRSLFITACLVYPILFGIASLLPQVVEYLVSQKWQPAISSFYLFAFSTYFAAISTPLTNVLNAIGHVKYTLYLMIMWTILTWVLTPILTYFYGFEGVAISSFVISFSSIATVMIVKSKLNVEVLKSITSPTIASIIMAMITYFVSLHLVRDKLSLCLTILLGALVYSLVIFILEKDRLIKDLKSIRYG